MDALAKQPMPGHISIQLPMEQTISGRHWHGSRKALGAKIDPDKEIMVTCGGTEAMMCAMTICNPGTK